MTRLQTTGVSPALSFDYAYDLDGNQRVKTDAVGKTTRYVYDLFGRLTREESPAATTAYTYDRCHNRLSMSRAGETTAYAYDKAAACCPRPAPPGQRPKPRSTPTTPTATCCAASGRA